MIDVAGLHYRLVLDKGAQQYDLQDYLEELTWEESQQELSARITFTVNNAVTAEGKLSELLKLGDRLIVYAGDKTGEQETARGFLTDWKATSSSNSEQFQGVCYDDLYSLLQSQENYYFTAGLSTSSLLRSILKDWSLELASYQGPEAKHGKLAFQGAEISSVLMDILDEAEKKTGKKAVLRAEQGKVWVLEYGTNPEVYRLDEESLRMASLKRTTADMVTRVKVVGQEDKEGKRPVEQTLNGLTAYGIRQQIYSRPSDHTMEEAKSAAQEILDTKGVIQEEISLESPDLPFLKKGDRIHIQAGELNGDYFILGISHDAGSVTMSLELKRAEKQTVSENKTESKAGGWKPGDIVFFRGGTHYVSSEPKAKGYPAKPGKAKVTAVKSGSAHPWHIIHLDGTSKVYGWVDASAVGKVEE